jgi:predicted lipid-binding transport protein (Tim44 family)
MNASIIQLLVLAGIAIFLFVKLRSVLGTRDGFEKPPLPLEDVRPRARRDFEVIDGGPDRDITDLVPDGSPAAKALAAMKAAEPGFSVGTFLQGARGAYEMILMAFDKGEMDRIKPFLAPDVFDTFSEAVAEREKGGLRIESTFVGLREMVLHDATFDLSSREADVSVRFLGEMTSLVRNAAGEVVEGSPTEIKKQRDVWTFSRQMGANDPNWRLSATGD